MRIGSQGSVAKRAIFIAIAVAGLVAPSTSVSAQVVRAPEVVKLLFDGNEAFTDSELRAVIRTRRTECVSFLLNPFCWVTDWGFAHRRSYLDSLDVAGDALRLRSFYTLRGFFDSNVQHVIRPEGEDALVGFVVSEGDPTAIDSFEVQGLPETMSQSTAGELLAIGVGDRFDQIQLEVGKDSLVRALREQGFIEALVLQDARRETGGPARVTLDVSPGRRFRVGEIRLQGAAAIGDRVVRSLLTLQTGQFFSQRRGEESQRNLFALDAVRFAAITSQPAPGAAGDSIVDVDVVITPAITRAARGGFGWSTDECLQTEATLTHRNLFGGAKRLSVTARLKNIFAQQLGGAFPCSDVGTDSDFRTLNFLLEAELFVPVFLTGRNSFRATVFGERETVPDVFIREGVGAEFALSRRLNRRMTATFGYQPEFTGFDEESADIFFCVNFGFCAPEDIAIVSQARWLAPVSFGWVFTGTNDAIQPTDGFYITAELENAGTLTGSAYQYVRGALQLAGFTQLREGSVLAGRTRFGVVEPTRGPFSVTDPTRSQEVIHPGKRFFAGGSQSVRGFGQNLLGPRVLVADQVEDCANEALINCVDRLAAEDPGGFTQRPNGGNASFELSLELREVLSPRWGLVLFLDAGNVWKDLSNLEAPIWTPGAGIRFRSPVGPIRFDVGYDPSGPTRLPVLVSLDNGTLIEIDNPVLFDPFTFDNPSLLREILRRFQFHISIGEAF